MKNNASFIIVRVSLGAALICICTWISIPFTVPFTMQTFAVCLIAALYGTQIGFFSVVVYILLGICGLPVFSGFRGGIGVLLGATGGYIVGFLFTALIVGITAKALGKRNIFLFFSMVVGVLVCYCFGTAWFMFVYARTKGSIGLIAALGMCVFPYIVPDTIKILLAIFLHNRLYRFLR